MVSDEGPGFPDEFVEKPFDRFSRAETSRSSSGTGLGLALVKAVGEAHGGTATVQGTQVSLALERPASENVAVRPDRMALAAAILSAAHWNTSWHPEMLANRLQSTPLAAQAPSVGSTPQFRQKMSSRPRTAIASAARWREPGPGTSKLSIRT